MEQSERDSQHAAAGVHPAVEVLREIVDAAHLVESEGRSPDPDPNLAEARFNFACDVQFDAMLGADIWAGQCPACPECHEAVLWLRVLLALDGAGMLVWKAGKSPEGVAGALGMDPQDTAEYLEDVESRARGAFLSAIDLAADWLLDRIGPATD